MDRNDLATRGFAVSINRALALYVTIAVAASVVMAFNESDQINSGWLLLVVVLLALGTVSLLVATSLLDWSKLFHVLLAVTVLAALITWPVAWDGSIAHQAPFLWLLIPAAILLIGWAAQPVRWVVLVVAPLVTTMWGIVRLSPGGGSASVLVASQEAILVNAQAIGITYAIALGYRAAEQLDASTDRAAAIVEQIAIRASMRREQRTLDALVHDQVMTTLAAAGRETMSRERVSDMAMAALAALAGYDAVDSGGHITGAETVTAVTDAVNSVDPSASVNITTEEVALPHIVCEAVTRATQEAVLNASKHAAAQHIAVTGYISHAGDNVTVSLTITDDGVGFVLDDVPEKRLGVRLALQGRMRAVGGRADVESAPNRGTTISLHWLGEAHMANTLDIPAEVNPGTYFQQLDLPTLAWIGRLQFFVTLAMGMVSMAVAGRPVGWLLLALFATAGLITFGARVYRRLGWIEIAAIAITLSVGGAAKILVFGEWTTIDVLIVVMILFVTRFRGSSLGGWLVFGLTAVSGTIASIVAAVPIMDTMIGLIGPLLSITLADYLSRWLSHVETRVEAAHAEFEEASSRAASLFSTLLSRDVWMVSVRSHVEPVLQLLATPSVPLTEADRAQCVRLEARLRDSITARNLASPAVSQAVEEARERGVSVTLVDNRQGALPELAREAARLNLAAAAHRANGGRIVARVAPEGYRDLVTIMTDSDDGARLISIDEEGQVTEK